jgi:rSAM/selenodomain-associated transferase 2
MQPLVSVIVPVFDEEIALPPALAALARLPGRFEFIVVDGGSRDRTVAVARAHELRPLVLRADSLAGGRGAQLNAACVHARGELLLFLHADTRLPPTAYRSLATAYADSRLVGGNFALRFDGLDGLSRLLGCLYAGLRKVGVYYGDSALWVRREVFAALGGFRRLPIMDDYDFARRLERAGRTACLPGPALTSARRWHVHGSGRTVATWALIQVLYSAGVPPERLARLYDAAR